MFYTSPERACVIVIILSHCTGSSNTMLGLFALAIYRIVRQKLNHLKCVPWVIPHSYLSLPKWQAIPKCVLELALRHDLQYQSRLVKNKTSECNRIHCISSVWLCNTFGHFLCLTEGKTSYKL